MKSISLRSFAVKASVCPPDMLSELGEDRADLAPSPVGAGGRGWGESGLPHM